MCAACFISEPAEWAELKPQFPEGVPEMKTSVRSPSVPTLGMWPSYVCSNFLGNMLPFLLPPAAIPLPSPSGLNYGCLRAPFPPLLCPPPFLPWTNAAAIPPCMWPAVVGSNLGLPALLENRTVTAIAGCPGDDETPSSNKSERHDVECKTCAQ